MLSAPAYAGEPVYFVACAGESRAAMSPVHRPMHKESVSDSDQEAGEDRRQASRASQPANRGGAELPAKAKPLPKKKKAGRDEPPAEAKVEDDVD